MVSLWKIACKKGYIRRHSEAALDSVIEDTFSILVLYAMQHHQKYFEFGSNFSIAANYYISQQKTSSSSISEIWSIFPLSSALEPKILWIWVKLSVKELSNNCYLLWKTKTHCLYYNVLPYCLPSTTPKILRIWVKLSIKVINMCLLLFLL